MSSIHTHGVRHQKQRIKCEVSGTRKVLSYVKSVRHAKEKINFLK